MDGATATALLEAFKTFEARDDLKVAVLTGAGGTFCAVLISKPLDRLKRIILNPQGRPMAQWDPRGYSSTSR